MDALQNHLANTLGDEDLSTAQLLLEKLLETSGGEDSEASRDPEVQRNDPDNFQGQDRRKRMAGDQRPQEGKLAKILAAKTR